MPIYVVRHTHAGHRRDWDGPDHERPLTDKGRRDADHIATLLGGVGISEIWSSPYVRCVESVEPLAETCDLTVGRSDALAEGSSRADTVDLVERLAASSTTAALCSHGDVIPELLEALARRGTDLDPNGACPKGSIWILRVDDGRIVRADYAGKDALPA